MVRSSTTENLAHLIKLHPPGQGEETTGEKEGQEGTGKDCRRNLRRWPWPPLERELPPWRSHPWIWKESNTGVQEEICSPFVVSKTCTTSNKHLEKIWGLVGWLMEGEKAKEGCGLFLDQRRGDRDSKGKMPLIGGAGGTIHTPPSLLTAPVVNSWKEGEEKTDKEERETGWSPVKTAKGKPSGRPREPRCLISPRVWGTSWLQLGASKSRSWVFVLARTFNVHFFGCVAYPKREQG